MSSWIPRTSVVGIRYGDANDGTYWYYPTNPGAYYDSGLGTYDLALPNCTTYAYGRVLEQGSPAPISGWHSAQAWHNALANGWTYVGYSFANVEVGDILEWSSGRNHVAVVEKIENGIIYVSESIYRDDNGGSTGYRSPGVWGSTKAEVNAYGLANYPNDYFHYGRMSYAYGYYVDPTYILKNPMTFTDEKFKFFSHRKLTKRRLTRYA